jgi:hypothetical protein
LRVSQAAAIRKRGNARMGVSTQPTYPEAAGKNLAVIALDLEVIHVDLEVLAADLGIGARCER